MEREEILIVDLILKRMPYDQAITLYGGLWYDLLRNYTNSDDIVFRRMQEIIQNNNWRKVVTFLGEQGYIETVNHSIPNHKLTQRGKSARDMGGHEAFFSWEKEQERLMALQQQKAQRDQRRINWPQKYWWVVAIATLVLGWFADIGKDMVKEKYFPEKPLIPANSKSDTFNVAAKFEAICG